MRSYTVDQSSQPVSSRIASRGQRTRHLLQQARHIRPELFAMCAQERLEHVLGARLRAGSTSASGNSSRSEAKTRGVAHSEVKLPAILLFLVHPFLRIFLPLLQILRPQWQHARDEHFGEALHELGRDWHCRRAIPIAEHRLDEQERLDDETGRIPRTQIVCTR